MILTLWYVPLQHLKSAASTFKPSLLGASSLIPPASAESAELCAWMWLQMPPHTQTFPMVTLTSYFTVLPVKQRLVCSNSSDSFPLQAQNRAVILFCFLLSLFDNEEIILLQQTEQKHVMKT